MSFEDSRVMISSNPVVLSWLTRLRSADTPMADFRALCDRVAAALCLDALQDAGLSPRQVNTPLAAFEGHQLADRIVGVAILRAGVGMISGLDWLLPEVPVGIVGLARDPKTLEPTAYYENLPAGTDGAHVLLLDPMLATGGTVVESLDRIRRAGAAKVQVISIIGAVPGVRKVLQHHPDTRIVLGALDDKLNEKGYIVPGLGDSGDRLFGTE